MSQQIADTASQAPQIGLPANAPARPAQQMAYPAVHDVPPPRTAVMLTDIEQRKLETDLVSARDQQQAAAGVTPAMKAQFAKERAEAKKKADQKADQKTDKKADKDKAKKDQGSQKQSDRDRSAGDQSAQSQNARDPSSTSAPISASSSRTIY